MVDTKINVGYGKKRESKKKSNTKLLKNLSKKIPSKRILKNSKSTYKIEEYKSPSVLGDPNRFFKEEMEEAKQAIFFK